jgi:hypothetical protein
VKQARLAGLLVLAVGLPLTAMAGCTGGTPESGRVTGALEAVGGPAPGTPRPLPGRVFFKSVGGELHVASVATDGKFSLILPAGSYTVTGRSRQYEGGNLDCRASGAVTVAAGGTVHVLVSCQEV